MDQAASLDVSALLLAHSGLSLLASVSVAPVYNLPLALYGLVVVRSGGADDGGDGVRQFALLFGSSFLLDLLWLMSGWRADTAGLALLLILANLVLKPVTLLAALGHLRQRGESTFALPSSFPGGFSLPGSFPPTNPRETVWSAPGGARGGYQGFHDDEEEVGAPRATKGQPPAPAAVQQQQHQSKVPAGAEGGGYHTLE